MEMVQGARPELFAQQSGNLAVRNAQKIAPNVYRTSSSMPLKSGNIKDLKVMLGKGKKPNGSNKADAT